MINWIDFGGNAVRGSGMANNEVSLTYKKGKSYCLYFNQNDEYITKCTHFKFGLINDVIVFYANNSEGKKATTKHNRVGVTVNSVKIINFILEKLGLPLEDCHVVLKYEAIGAFGPGYYKLVKK